MALSVGDIIALVNQAGRGDPPSAIADMFVTPLAKMGNFLDAKGDLAITKQVVDDILATLRNSSEIDRYVTETGESEDTIIATLELGLDEIASNFGLTRRPAAPSRGTVLLYRSTQPTEAIPVQAGTIVAAPTINQEYNITTTIVIDPNGMTLDTDLNAFVFSVPIQSTGNGIDTVAAAGQITRIKVPIAGITGVTNVTPVVGGRDLESNENLAERIKSALSANNIGTKSGYRALLLSQDEVKDVVIVGAGDPLMTRDRGDGGSVDGYVANALPVQITDTLTTSNVTGSVFTPGRQPIIDDTSSISVTGFSPDPNNTVITKDNSIYSGSISAKDTITFDVPPPTDGSATVTYLTNDLVSRQQVFMDDSERKILGSDFMVREAISTPVDVICKIVVLPGFSGAVVKAEVESAVIKFISALNIAQKLEQSDVISVMTAIDGVDRVDLPLTKFDKQVNAGTLNTIVAGANEILIPGEIVANL